jgi:hypothetical protein
MLCFLVSWWLPCGEGERGLMKFGCAFAVQPCTLHIAGVLQRSDKENGRGSTVPVHGAHLSVTKPIF